MPKILPNNGARNITIDIRLNDEEFEQLQVDLTDSKLPTKAAFIRNKLLMSLPDLHILPDTDYTSQMVKIAEDLRLYLNEFYAVLIQYEIRSKQNKKRRTSISDHLDMLKDLHNWTTTLAHHIQEIVNNLGL